MRRSNWMAGICATACAGGLHAAPYEWVFSMESDTLRPLEGKALASLRAHVARTSYRDCAAGGFVGTVLALDGQGPAEDWIAMTADGCGWGASSARIWVLRRERYDYRVVLETGGHGLATRKREAAGLSDLKVVHHSAGYYSETRYSYAGKRYRASGSRHIDLSDPSACLRHRDLDVCAPPN